MNVTITEIPFKVKEKKISLEEFLERYASFLQDKENVKTVEHDIDDDNRKRYSLEAIRRKYVHSGI